MVERMFNTDNHFWQTVGKAGDLIALTFLTLLCSLPLITAASADHGGGGLLRHELCML
ncbi:putative uncharacterized protein [Clostridium sp. CAG:299]|nr:putative uncharacterized protein [Clostridium sp. CAG:299]